MPFKKKIEGFTLVIDDSNKKPDINSILDLLRDEEIKNNILTDLYH